MPFTSACLKIRGGNMKNSDYKRLLNHNHIGPGGWRCPCCGPSPKNKKRMKRFCKRSEKIKERRGRSIEEDIFDGDLSLTDEEWGDYGNNQEN